MYLEKKTWRRQWGRVRGAADTDCKKSFSGDQLIYYQKAQKDNFKEDSNAKQIWAHLQPTHEFVHTKSRKVFHISLKKLSMAQSIASCKTMTQSIQVELPRLSIWKIEINWRPTPASSANVNPMKWKSLERAEVFYYKNSKTIEQAGAHRRNLSAAARENATCKVHHWGRMWLRLMLRQQTFSQGIYVYVMKGIRV